MKRLLLLAVTLIAVFTLTKAQCPTHVKYTSGKMETLDSAMAVTDSKDIETVFETFEKGFAAGQEEHEDDSLHGTLKSATCNWKEAYKNGKTVMVCDVHTNHEDLNDATITIEAVDGKISIVLHAKEYPDKLIRLVVDKYEELK